jgi:CRISPR-associated protein (TIGR03986 family)
MLYAPYTFVPLSPWVFVPEWGPLVSHDLPFKDGLSGSIKIKITAHTPVLCGGERKTEPASYTNSRGQPVNFRCENTVYFTRLPDGTPAIPGYSLRNMIRSVIEIAAFGRMKLVDDKRFGVRDLTQGAQHIYGRRLFRIVGGAPPGARQVQPLIQAGWLRYDPTNKHWKVRPCAWARVSFQTLANLTGTKEVDWADREDIERRYRRLGGSPLPCNLSISGPIPHQHCRSRAQRPRERNGVWEVKQTRAPEHVDVLYARAHPPATGATGTNGKVVVTGSPQDHREFYHQEGYLAPGFKKQEFFFYNPPSPGPEKVLSQDVFKAFLDVHEPGRGRETANPNWAFWREKLKVPGTEVPIFYIADSKDEVEAFGLAMMFKLAHSRSVRQIIAHTSEDHLDEKIIDLADGMFGREAHREGQGEERARGGLKGRVSFEPAVVDGEYSEKTLGPTVLSGPKGSFYPAYVKQPLDVDGRGLRADSGRRLYASYTPTKEQPDGTPITQTEVTKPEIAGWKVYPARGDVHIPTPPDKIDKPGKVCTVLKPLDTGAVFIGRVHFHNLKPFEVGALLWALTWGGNKDLRHKLGMGRPLGLGEVSIEVESFEAFANVSRSAKTASCEALRDEFVATMNERHRADSQQGGDWLGSEQIRTLLAAADPWVGRAHFVAPVYMPSPQLFARAKQEGLVLPPYVVREMPAAPRHGGNQVGGHQQGRRGGHQGRDRDRGGNRDREPRARPAEYARGDWVEIIETEEILQVRSCRNNIVTVERDVNGRIVLTDFRLDQVRPSND